MTCRANAPLMRKRPADAPRFRSADVLRAARYCCPSGTFCGLRIKIWGFPPFSARPVSALQGFEDAVHCFLLRYPVCGGIGREAFLGEGRDAERDGHVAALYGLASGSFPCAPALFFACFFHNRFVFCIFALPAKRDPYFPDFKNDFQAHFLKCLVGFSYSFQGFRIPLFVSLLTIQR